MRFITNTAAQSTNRFAVKTAIAILTGLFAAVPLLAAPAATSPLFANCLQLAVLTPANLPSSRADEIVAELTDLVDTSFRNSGFHGQLTVVAAGEQPQRDQPELEIDVIDWQTSASGTIDCTFSATLRDVNGEQHLGLFTGTSLLMSEIPVSTDRTPFSAMRNSLDRAEAFADAAREAVDDLCGELSGKNLLPAQGL
jgi:hypothetical protein